MKNIYNIFKGSVKDVTRYYTLLVGETSRQRLVGSTNEWVLDNYYMVSEQEKVLRNELKGMERGEWRVEHRRVEVLWKLLEGYLKKCHHEVDKTLLFRYLSQVQVSQKDYLTYPEVCALLPLMKAILISELADLCRRLEREKSYHYQPTDKSQGDLEQLNKAAQENLQMMNIFNSLKKMTKLPVAELLDAVSFSEKMLKGEKAGMYDQMYDKTKDDYRAKIVRLSRKVKKSKRRKGEESKGRKACEYDLVKALVSAADEKGEHVGWQLFPPKRWNARAHSYIWIVSVASLLLAAVFAYGATGFSGVNGMSVVLTVLLWVPMSQIVIDLFNWLLGKLHKPMGTFKIKFKEGLIPDEYATMVIMPTILKNKAKTEELLEQLEVYYLSNINRGNGREGFKGSNGQNLYYTLVGDAASYKEADAPWDEEVVQAGLEKVKELNEKYGAHIFNFVYRRRAWSEGEQTWLGYERKRGAILHFNDLVLGETSEEEKQKRFRCETISAWLKSAGCGGQVAESLSATPATGTPIQFIITLDTDTELVLYSAQKLIGAMAHPLNRAKLSPDGHRVDSGYGIMQPRVNVDVEVTNKSRYAQLFAGLGGLDVYTTANFELYQDIFNEGSFCGKGIYDLRVFQKVLKGTFPENLILSHDLIEGCHIRCGLINDLELFDDNPSNYIDDAKRHHRWTRGDWQIISWLTNKVRNEKGERVKNQVNTIGRWKIFDNLRRSMLSLGLLVLIFTGYLLATLHTPISALAPQWFVLVTLVAVASPIVFFIIGQITTLPRFGKRYRYYMTLMRGFRVIIYRSLVQFALLPKEAWMYTDAAVRACYRMWFSHHNLLAWITSDEAAKSTKGTLGDYLGKFWFNYVASAFVLAICWLGHLTLGGWGAAVFCAVTWCGAPFLMYWLGKKFPQDKKHLGEKEIDEVRRLAHHTWGFFDSLITEENNWLIPDNYQLNRESKTDYKTSPTNIGYSLTAVVSAAELGFISQKEAVNRLEHIVDTVLRLEKWNGHLYNWYSISTLKALPNFFISTCDSGNFVACLYVVKGWLASKSQKDEESKSSEDSSSLQLIDSLTSKVERLIAETDFMKLYNPELDVFSIGYDTTNYTLLPYHYNNFASEARLTSFLTIAQGDAPYKHWFCLDKTLVQYKGYKGVASWYGTLFEYFMPLIFLPTYKHTLMDETYSFAIRAQRAFIKNTCKGMPWGISETAYNELDDAQNYKYHAFGVPYLKFQNTTPDRIVISPYSSLMTIGVDDRAVYENIRRFKSLGMYDDYGFYESYDEEDHVPVKAHYAHHQGMILASLANYLTSGSQDQTGATAGGGCLQRYFMQDPAFRSMETLLKEKAQVKPYIDLKVTKYKRYRYSKVQTESDARSFDTIANVPEIGFISNGQYTVLMNDRGSGFSRYRSILLTRYRKITSDHHGTYLYIRNLNNDHLWCNTYAPLDVMPESYHVSFASDKISYLRVDDGIETKTEITVLKDRSAEIRRLTFTNNSGQDVDLELTTYGEVVLSSAPEDENHRVFNGMKITSEYDAEHQALFFGRPGNVGNRHYMLHRLWVNESDNNLVEYETSRLKFIGRGNSLRHADIIESRRTLTGTVGTTLDPVMSMRRRLHIAAGESEEAFILTGFAKAKEHLLQLSEQYQSSVDVEHAFKTASVFNNMRTSLSLLKGSQMRLYNSISKYMAQTANIGTERQSVLARNTLSQSDLWRFGISGDLDILLMEVDSMEHSGHAKEMLRAFEYFKVHGMRLDLVFINDAPEHDHQGLTHFIRNMANTEHLWAEHSDAGKVYVLDGFDLSEAERTLLHTVARLTFSTNKGITIAEQLRQLELVNQHYQDKVEYPVLKPNKEFRVWSNLQFYNQYGGFDNDGRDYVVTNTNTPMPWVNVIANEYHFGCIVSSTMAGFSFAHNAQQFKLTAWSNDIVRDTASEMLLIDKRQFVPATARHGQGWSAFDAEYDHLKVAVRLFVACDKPEKYYQIKVTNKTDAPLQVQLDMLYKLVLGQCEEQTARYLYSQWDPQSNSLLVRNVYHPLYHNQLLRLTATEPLVDVSLDYPNRKRLGLTLDLPADGSKELAFVIGVETLGAVDSVKTLRSFETISAEYDKVVDYWDQKLGTIQVETPDSSFNHMLNRWYLYQVYSSRLFARAGFYQVGGATGFRDQLQDVMSILYSDPAYARRQILDHAAHQFAEGDVLHWWHEEKTTAVSDSEAENKTTGFGARTTFSDDYLWLVFVTYQYVTVTGDISILSEQVPFSLADHLGPGEAERCVNYAIGTESASLYEHLRRSVNRSMSRSGIHGLPLMGCGDWNDGMSTVGVEGKGESVWVAFFLADLLPKMEQLTQLAPHADLSYCEELHAYRKKLVDAIQRSAWDGTWFLRAYYDNGLPIGSRNNIECQIDLISQAWAILTDVATPQQKQSVMRETDNRLVNREHEIIQLLTPAFKDSKPSPGYIMNYPVGVRENGGQYTHGAMWYIMAKLHEAKREDETVAATRRPVDTSSRRLLDEAYYLYSLINPIHRTNSLADVLKYKVEPYCIAADIYSNPQHPGRGGWTWYTGSASWAYKTGIENILGFRKDGDTLTVDPSVPTDWQSFTLRYKYGSSLYIFNYRRDPALASQPATLTLVDDGQEHVISLH